MSSRSTAPPISAADQDASKGKKPNKIVPVPPEFRRSTSARERNALINDVKLTTGCIVTPRWNYQKGQDDGTIYQFDLIGTGPSLESAVRHIHQWISKAPSRSKDSSAWGKTPAFDANKWYCDKIEEMEHERKQAFKGPPPESHECETPLHKTIVHWPGELDDRQISPRDVFNNKLEALDAIRMRDEVYITLLGNTSGEWQIEIQAHEKANLEAAEEHLKTMIEKVKTEEMGIQKTVSMVLDGQEGINVVYEQAGSWWPNLQDRVVPRLVSSGMMELPGSFRRDMVHPTQLSSIEHEFQSSLEAVRHRKGAYDMLIRLGCVTVRSRQTKGENIGTKCEKDDFLRLIHTSLQLEVKKWLANDATGHQMLKTLCAADKLLEPIKPTSYSGYIPGTLDKTRPILRGTWVFRDPSSDIPSPREPIRHAQKPVPPVQNPITNPNVLLGLILIEVEWIEDDEGSYEKSLPRFYRLEQGANGPKKHMDISLIELGESRGWQFALDSVIPISPRSVPPILTKFIEQVRMKPGYNHESTEKFADWDATPTVKKYLEVGRLDAIYSFGIRETYYKVELKRMWYPTQKLPVWALAVRHSEWANRLAELEHLPVGRKADWGHTLTTFLPNDGQSSYAAPEEDEDVRMSNLSLGSDIAAPPRNGIRILIEKLLQVSAAVSSTKLLQEASEDKD